jgi:hypothetical protein
MPGDVGICELCKKGKVIKSGKEMRFRQLTDKGYVYCRVTIWVGVCDHCGSRSFDQDDDKILDEAVRREYDKLPCEATKPPDFVR